MNNRQQTLGRNADAEKREGDTQMEEEEHENQFGSKWKLLRHASYGKTR